MFWDSILILVVINIVLIAILPSNDGNKFHMYIKRIFWILFTVIILLFSYNEYLEQMNYS